MKKISVSPQNTHEPNLNTSEKISTNKILIFSATYNEADNIENLLTNIFEYLPGQEVLIVDDASPDGTGEILDKFSRIHKQVNVFHRPRKLGLGTAHKLAMQYAIKNEFDILITMDADFSHHPKYLPTLVNLMEKYDFVIGSRHIEGGGLSYGFFRRTLSITANILARNMLKIPLKECTTSYRGFRVSLLKKMNLDSIRSEGYSFFVESIYFIHRLTGKISEFPIFFYDRQSGVSKISKVEIIKSLICLLKLFYSRIASKQLTQKIDCHSHFSQRCANCNSIFLSQTSNVETQQGLQKEHSLESVQCLECGTLF